jgi:hypothetical protein
MDYALFNCQSFALAKVGNPLTFPKRSLLERRVETKKPGHAEHGRDSPECTPAKVRQSFAMNYNFLRSKLHFNERAES